jgi:uncharacterized protein YbjT (DUF2867 family)
MAAAAKPIALIVGATGAQGGSVAAALADNYRIRALTRDPSKPKAQALVAKGYELFKGDLGDLDSLRAALTEDVKVAFLVTQFWEKLDAQKELQEGCNFIQAVAALPEAKRPMLFLSVLEDVTAASGGKIRDCKHFDAKGKVWKCATEKGVTFTPLLMGSYFSNFLGFFKPKALGDGSYEFTLPNIARYNSASVEDIGRVVKAIIPRYKEFIGRPVPVVSDLRPMEEVLQLLGKAVGKKVSLRGMSCEEFASKSGVPMAAELAAMFAFYDNAAICDRDPKLAKSLVPDMLSLEQWAQNNKQCLLEAWSK